MLIREFVPADVKRVLEIEINSFDEESYGLNMFLKLHEMGIGFLVAEEEGYVIGYVLFWIKHEYEGHIISIAVDEKYRHSKVGTKLLSHAIMVLNQCNIEYITLEVNENNDGAFNFYKKFNFEVDRLVPGYYSNEDGAIVMKLEVKRV
ncbi:MAG: ribosomal protein S18-alanine N-acetyltransferase [Methanobrevibacter sp.]|uniref:ribosomal protein S18-alanine N-acetyltransferase n=1 Tax=Methanobrevibacter sp. TaxID=66852 RepID=UPI0026DF139C|nr:ribosomal protein S18-alanine N-acetyltransferase [Methanobrevibacter sp.]MDO5848258.1 ribosomal protein S18-alanine N-acetyltransferase [Methanobrevibacter sp.]